MNKAPLKVGGVPEHFNSPWQQALQADSFDVAGVPIIFTEFPTGTGAMCQALREGQLDVAVVLTEGLLSDIFKTGSSRLIAPYVLSPLRWGVFAGAEQAKEHFTDFNNPTFGVSRIGSGSHLMGSVMAQEQHWSHAQFEILGDIDALEKGANSGQCDLFLWERYTTKPRVDSGQLKSIGETPTPWPCFMIAATVDAIETRRDELKELLKVLYGYTTAFMTEPEQAIAFAAQRYDLSLADIQKWYSEVTLAQGPQLPLDDLENCLMTLQKVGILPAEPIVLDDLIFNLFES